jgi:hypothetical protein
LMFSSKLNKKETDNNDIVTNKVINLLRNNEHHLKLYISPNSIIHNIYFFNVCIIKDLT